MKLELKDGTAIEIIESIEGDKNSIENSKNLRLSIDATSPSTNYKNIETLFNIDNKENLNMLTIYNPNLNCKVIYRGYCNVDSIVLRNNRFQIVYDIVLIKSNDSEEPNTEVQTL